MAVEIVPISCPMESFLSNYLDDSPQIIKRISYLFYRHFKIKNPDDFKSKEQFDEILSNLANLYPNLFNMARVGAIHEAIHELYEF